MINTIVNAKLSCKPQVIIRNVIDVNNYHSFGENYEWVGGNNSKEYRNAALKFIAEVQSRLEAKIKAGTGNQLELLNELKDVNKQITREKNKIYLTQAELITDEFVVFTDTHIK